MVTTQAPVPVHVPLQPVNVEPVSAAAARVTAALQEARRAVGAAGDAARTEVTVPCRCPSSTVRSWVGARTKVAVTLGCVDGHDAGPGAGAGAPPAGERGSRRAVPSSVTVVPSAKFSAQSAPQVMPAGVEVTVPAPVPVFRR